MEVLNRKFYPMSHIEKLTSIMCFTEIQVCQYYDNTGSSENCHKCWTIFQSLMQLISIDEFIFMVQAEP